MSKHIFKRIAIRDIGKPLKIRTSSFDIPKKEEEEGSKPSMLDESIDSSKDDALTNEILEKEREIEEEILLKKKELEEEVEKTRKEAENFAFSKIKEATELYDAKVNESEMLASKKIEGAELEASAIIEKAEKEARKLETDAYQKGFDEGSEIGFNSGKEEVVRLVDRLNTILSTTINKRSQVVEEAESHIVDIIITIARKVVKSISESHKRVVYDNITEALRKLKGRAEVTIRVNTEDLQMTTKHKKEFVQMIEGIEQVRILEDNSVDRGGCYISTDFGTIDARISTQLSEIEEQIKKLSPQKEEL